MKESSRRRKAKYSEEFKRDAVALAEESSVSAVIKVFLHKPHIFLRYSAYGYDELQYLLNVNGHPHYLL